MKLNGQKAILLLDQLNVAREYRVGNKKFFAMEKQDCVVTITEITSFEHFHKLAPTIDVRFWVPIITHLWELEFGVGLNPEVEVPQK